MTVATFIVETEDSVSTQEALSIIKSWNPAFFMCDFADEEYDYAGEEISSIESVFPAICEVIIFNSLVEGWVN